MAQFARGLSVRARIALAPRSRWSRYRRRAASCGGSGERARRFSGTPTASRTSSRPIIRACSTPTATRRWRGTPSCWCGYTRRRADAPPSSTATRSWTAIAGCARPAFRRKRRQWAAQQTPEFGALIRAFAAGLNAWAAEAPEHCSAPRQRRAAADAGRRLRARAAHHPLRLAHQRAERLQQGAPRSVETHGSNGWAIAPCKERVRQRDAPEQLAPAVGRTATRISKCS